MDQVGLGAMVASLVAKKALERAADAAGEEGWSALTRLATRVRSWFRDRDDEAGRAALELVEQAPDSQRALEALAERVSAAAREDPETARQVHALVGEIEQVGDRNLTQFINQVRDHARVGRIVQVNGNYHEHGN